MLDERGEIRQKPCESKVTENEGLAGEREIF